MINKQRKLFGKINMVDLAVIVAVLLFSLTLFFYFLVPKKEYTQSVFATIVVRENLDLILDEAEKQKVVYVNSVNQPVEVVKTEKILSKNQEIEALKITLKAPGEVGGNRYIFNGERILVGQKAEIHSTYFAKGMISKVSYELD